MSATATAPAPADLEQARNWPYKFEVLPLDKIVADPAYQRPLTNFVNKIIVGFDPALVGTLVVSARKQGRYAVVDGQTRMEAMKELGMEEVPCLVYSGLTQAEEASLFARLQKERRGIASYHRFRAALVAGEQEPKDIEAICREVGYAVGLDKGEISAVAALEYGFRKDPEILERVLLIYKAAWPMDPNDRTKEFVPSGDLLRGMAYLLWNGVGRASAPVDDEKMADRLKGVTPEAVRRRASALREGVGGGGSVSFLADALAVIYRSKT